MICPGCAAEIPPGFKFCGNCGQKLDSPPEPVPPPPLAALGERREVAILFADVSGFTAMCERLDPEEVHAVMNECFAGLGQAIQGEDGHIDKYIGDNVMALFGAPTAHEDDPARACRAHPPDAGVPPRICQAVRAPHGGAAAHAHRHQLRARRRRRGGLRGPDGLLRHG